ncbi:MAG: response regulator transcription factor [Ruminococcaceae bacterium]|nr:response regulator transcription factor [Oscillospiraceae bacterium]
MTKICICDDSESARLTLQRRLDETNLFDNAEYSFCSNGDSLIREINKGIRYDFIFLDADMPGHSGTETGKMIYSVDKTAVIIFVSSYPQYAIEAFDCHAYAYLLKDSDNERFLSVIKGAVEKRRLSGGFRYLRTRDGTVFCPLSEIYYMECLRKQLIYYTEKEKYITRELIGETETKTEDLGFCRVHKGYIVNLSKIHHITKTDVILTNGAKVPISTRKRTYVIERFNDYVRRYIL